VAFPRRAALYRYKVSIACARGRGGVGRLDDYVGSRAEIDSSLPFRLYQQCEYRSEAITKQGTNPAHIGQERNVLNEPQPRPRAPGPRHQLVRYHH
jgi:hypothetical protein